MAGVVVLHTADLHNRLSGRAAERLQELKRSHPFALLLDAGDAVAAGNLTFRPGGEPILRLMAEIGYDAMAMGNRESHPMRLGLTQKLRDAAFPVLSANIVARRGSLPEAVRRYAVFERQGLRLAVFAITPQMTKPASVWGKVTDYVFEEPAATAATIAAELRKEADLVICLSHCGVTVDREVAALPEVDVVLGGHSHRALIEQPPGSAAIVHSGVYGRQVSRTRILSREHLQSELLPLEAEA
jgi:2',3'-cyclic-nucleotide 2'-phosphodiesterase (5'-nucleotidase family)